MCDVLFRTLQLDSFTRRNDGHIRSPQALTFDHTCLALPSSRFPSSAQRGHPTLWVWMPIVSALEISHKGAGMPSSCTKSPLGMKAPVPVGTCNDPLLCWFLEVPEAMKSLQVALNFLQRPTRWLRYLSKLPAQQARGTVRNGGAM